eukprot:2616874-Amphidinium_carterae.2
MALALASRQQQDLMPTTIAIFSDVDVEAPPSLLQTPVNRPNRNESIQTSGSKTTAASPVGERSSILSISPEGAARAGRVHAAPAPGGGDGGGGGSDPPDPPGGGYGDDDWHRDWDRDRGYRGWDDARSTHNTQPKPQTIDKHKRAIS